MKFIDSHNRYYLTIHIVSLNDMVQAILYDNDRYQVTDLIKGQVADSERNRQLV